MYQIWERDVPSTAMHRVGEEEFWFSAMPERVRDLGVPKSLIGRKSLAFETCTSYSPGHGCLPVGISSQDVYFFSRQQLPIMSTAYPPVISKQPFDFVAAHVCSQYEYGTLM